MTKKKNRLLLIGLIGLQQTVFAPSATPNPNTRPSSGVYGFPTEHPSTPTFPVSATQAKSKPPVPPKPKSTPTVPNQRPTPAPRRTPASQTSNRPPSVYGFGELDATTSTPNRQLVPFKQQILSKKPNITIKKEFTPEDDFATDEITHTDTDTGKIVYKSRLLIDNTQSVISIASNGTERITPKIIGKVKEWYDKNGNLTKIEEEEYLNNGTTKIFTQDATNTITVEIKEQGKLKSKTTQNKQGASLVEYDPKTGNPLKTTTVIENINGTKKTVTDHSTNTIQTTFYDQDGNVSMKEATPQQKNANK